MSPVADVVANSAIYINTDLAAAGGVVAAIVLTQSLHKKLDLMDALNGVQAGLVVITAEPLIPSLGLAIQSGCSD